MKDGANELSNANTKYYHPFSSLSTYVFNGGCINFWINRLMSHSNTAKKKICSPSVMSLMNLASEFAPGCGFCHEASDFLHSMQEAREAFESCQAFSIFWGFDAEQAVVSTILLGFASCVYCMLRCLGALGVSPYPSSLRSPSAQIMGLDSPGSCSEMHQSMS